MNSEILDRLKKISERLKKNYNAEKVILFGSYARGEETEDSDMDLLVILPTEEPMHKRVLRMRKLLRDFRIPKDIIVYTPQEVEKWKNVTNAFITSIMRRGKVIYGL